MGSGKTELSQYFLEHFNGTRIAFADALKADIINYGFTPDGQIVKSRDRGLLQAYGQFRRGEIFRVPLAEGSMLCNVDGYAVHRQDYSHGVQMINMGKNYPNYWVDQAMTKASQLGATSNIIMDDIRRLNEAEALKSNNFTIIKIWASDETRKRRLIARDGKFDETLLNDISESEVDNIPYDAILDNNKDDENGKNSLHQIVTKLLTLTTS